MQRIFDIENEKDMADLWDILPDETDKITRNDKIWDCIYVGEGTFRSLLKINWHDKTEITRPVNYEDMIGCVGYFWDEENESVKVIGILKSQINKEYCLESYDGSCWKHFTPAKKSELNFYEDKKDV
jgi:hypothetical protein